MKTITVVLFIAASIFAVGCNEQNKSPVHMREGIGSDSLIDNIVTRPIANAFSALIGEGIDVNQSIIRTNDAGFLEVYVKGFNRSTQTKRFRYKVEWLDKDNLPISNKTSVWQRVSATGKSNFTIKAVAPSRKAINFTMDTKKWE